MLKKMINFVLGGFSILLIGITINAIIGSMLAIQVDEANIGTGYMTQPSMYYPSFQPIIRLERNDGVLCSGVVIDTQYALTAAHCAIGSWGLMYKEPIDILDQFGSFTDTQAIVVAIDSNRDIALIKANFESFQNMPLLEDSVIEGPLVSCGFAGGGNMYCTALQLVGGGFFKLLARGGAIFPGMSGGPVVDIASKSVIGVNSAIQKDGTVQIAPVMGALETWGIR